jgi:NAD(P)-dependent dehydrogenase (short-subunit alcohol dehydrogenase family)
MNPDSIRHALENYTPPANCLADQTILVTGAGGGIGRELALAAAGLGARMVLLDLNRKALEALYDEMEAAGLPPATIVPLDLASTEPAGYTELVEHLDELDALVHCAADVGALCPLENYDKVNWHRVMQVNLNSAYLLSMACLKLLRNSGRGSIIFTTADVARQGRAYWGAYAIAGHAVEGLAQVLAAELSGDRRVTVNTIDPGVVATRFRSSLYPAEDPKSLPQPIDVVPLYLYLLDRAATEGLTGQQLTA